MRIKLKNSLTLDADQLSCSESAKGFVNYAFSLNGNQVEPDFDTIMMGFTHALEHTIREGSVCIGDCNPVKFDISCVPEAISAMAAAYPELAVYDGFSKWLSPCNAAHKKHLPQAGLYSDCARVAACWWGERMVRPGARLLVAADEVNARLETMVRNRAAIDKAYADFLDAMAKHIDEEVSLTGICVVYEQKFWLQQLTANLDEQLGKLGEGSGGTWFLTEEIMKITKTRVLVTERDCTYCEILPGDFLTEGVNDNAIYRACDRHGYGKFISAEDFRLDY